MDFGERELPAMTRRLCSRFSRKNFYFHKDLGRKHVPQNFPASVYATVVLMWRWAAGRGPCRAISQKERSLSCALHKHGSILSNTVSWIWGRRSRTEPPPVNCPVRPSVQEGESSGRIPSGLCNTGPALSTGPRGQWRALEGSREGACAL